MINSLEPDVIRGAAEALEMSEETLVAQGIRSLIEQRLRSVDAEIFEITGRYRVSSVAEMQTLYESGAIEEADSWQDLQRLDHLEYARDQLRQLLARLT